MQEKSVTIKREFNGDTISIRLTEEEINEVCRVRERELNRKDIISFMRDDYSQNITDLIVNLAVDLYDSRRGQVEHSWEMVEDAVDEATRELRNGDNIVYKTKEEIVDGEL